MTAATAAGAITTAAAATGESSRPSWILLSMYASVGEHLNETTAQCDGRNDVKISASLVRERPPLPSRLYLNCSGASFGEPPHLLAMVDNLILFHVYTGDPLGFPTHETSDFFMYRADPRRPSLKLLPRPKVLIRRNDPYGIFPRGEDHYTIASLIPLQSPSNVFSLKLYDSETEIWSWKMLHVETPQKEFPVPIPNVFCELFSHHTTTVFTHGENIGWVDLWRGIVFCDMLSGKHTLRGVPLPLPLKCTQYHVDSSKFLGHASMHRGFAFTNGCFRVVELDIDIVADVPHVFDEETGWPLCRTENWTLTTWTNKKMSNSYDDWKMDCTLKASDIFLGDHTESGLPPMALQNLLVSNPIIGMNENDSHVIYLTARVKYLHPNSWVLAIDTKNLKVQSVAVRSRPIPQQRRRYRDAHYCACSISK